MAAVFLPPANLSDFDRSGNAKALRDSWHQTIKGDIAQNAGSSPAFYDPLAPPTNDAPATAAPEWTGLPRTIRLLVAASVAAAAAKVEMPIAMGNPDPMYGNYTFPFMDTNGKVFSGPAYRPQDEYLEWAVTRDPDGTIVQVDFTCEGPEYWETLATDQQLVVQLYREIVGDNSVQWSDLAFPTDVTWQSRNGPAQSFKAGDYNPYNKWNLRGAVHLTQPANTLGAEITLAQQATCLYGKPTLKTTDPDLICCAAYGEVNRSSDPTIGSAVNTQVRQGNRVSLRNPIGLYIKAIDTNAFTLADGSPFTQAAQCFSALRPAPNDVKDMIVRARFRVPAGVTAGAKQLRVGDLRVNGEQIVTGGQIADVVTMTLFALAIPGAPKQQPMDCQYRPCPDSHNPNYIHPVPYSMQCPPGGTSALQRNLALAAVDAVALGSTQKRFVGPSRSTSIYLG